MKKVCRIDIRKYKRLEYEKMRYFYKISNKSKRKLLLKEIEKLIRDYFKNNLERNIYLNCM